MSRLEKSLKRLCYRYENGIWIKSIGCSLVAMKINNTDETILAKQVFVGHDNTPLVWTSKIVSISQIDDIYKLIQLETDVCRNELFKSTNGDFVEMLLPEINYYDFL